MKVPIETNDVDERHEDATDVEQKQAEATEEKAAMTPEEEEQARIEEAIRRGEEAAEREIAEDAERLRKERDDLQKQITDAADEAEAAKRTAADATNRLKGLQRDWDNYRKRTEQERKAERERAAEKLVVSLLPVLDDMERAIDHAESQEGAGEQLEQFVGGVKAVHDKMVDILASQGVEVIDPAGSAFDPLVHQAVGRVEDADAFDETVAQVYQKGYRMGGKVIRSAMVTVTFGGPKRPEEPAAEGADASVAND